MERDKKEAFDRLKAVEMAYTALKKQPAYLRLIRKYQTRQKNQSAEITRLLAENKRLKEISWKKFDVKTDHEKGVKVLIGEIPEIDEETAVSDGNTLWEDRFLCYTSDNGLYFYYLEMAGEIEDGLWWTRVPLQEPYKETK